MRALGSRLLSLMLSLPLLLLDRLLVLVLVFPVLYFRYYTFTANVLGSCAPSFLNSFQDINTVLHYINFI